ncbi:MAG TPA: response regulator transcription factor [Microlunatus sp.]|nr:response regulator transcription factor [Microlunatus sp.]
MTLPPDLDVPGDRVAPPRILVVEDDPQLSGMLAELLDLEGYEVEVARDGQRGLHLGLTHEFDVIVLDRGLPAIDGLDLLARLRARGVDVPVLVLSALGLARDRVEGLDAGAEDYLSKPFDVDELLARLRALRRRHVDVAEELRLPGGAVLQLQSRTAVTADGTHHPLSEREGELLTLLARRPTQVFSRPDLRELVFADAAEDGVVDTYVHYLRRKLGRGVVRTVRGVGYQLGAG